MRFWRWLTTGRYTRWLEEEVARLREDRDEARRQVWALVNSLVSTAGAPLPQEVLRAAQAKTPGISGEAKPVARGKKSWHQRAIALEMESRKAMEAIRGNTGAPAANAGPKGE